MVRASACWSLQVLELAMSDANRLRELEVECGERDVVPEPDLDIGPEHEPFHQGPGFYVSADVDLVGVDADAGSEPWRNLRRCGRRHEPAGEPQHRRRNAP